MIFEQIDRRKCKQETAELLSSAQVSPKGMTALYMLLLTVLNLCADFSDEGFVGIFVTIFASLLTAVLSAGFVLYCMAIRRGERAEYLTLFDGFSFVGKIILLDIIVSFFIFLWSMLFVIPGVIASYRYQFALFNLLENPGIGVMEALDMSKRQTTGYKSQLFFLDLSYLGWMLLARAPSVYLLTAVNHDLTMEILFDIPAPSAYFGLPVTALFLIFSVWQCLISLFYLSSHTCAQLAYFETAKRTSGVGAGAGEDRPPWGGWNAPDGLG